MRWLLPLGVVLTLAGFGGTLGACYQLSSSDSVVEGPDGGVPAQQNDEPSSGPTIVAIVSGMALATGLLLVGVGVGHWQRPTPSFTRPANPWSEQPGEKGDPPTGLV